MLLRAFFSFFLSRTVDEENEEEKEIDEITRCIYLFSGSCKEQEEMK